MTWSRGNMIHQSHTLSCHLLPIMRLEQVVLLNLTDLLEWLQKQKLASEGTECTLKPTIKLTNTILYYIVYIIFFNVYSYPEYNAKPLIWRRGKAQDGSHHHKTTMSHLSPQFINLCILIGFSYAKMCHG